MEKKKKKKATKTKPSKTHRAGTIFYVILKIKSREDELLFLTTLEL